MALGEGPQERPKPGLDWGTGPPGGFRQRLESGWPNGPGPVEHIPASAAPAIQLVGHSHRSQSSCLATCYSSPLPAGHSLHSCGMPTWLWPTLLVKSAHPVTLQTVLAAVIPLLSGGVFPVCPTCSWPFVQAGYRTLDRAGPAESTEMSVFDPGCGLPHPYLWLFSQSSFLSEAFLAAANP